MIYQLMAVLPRKSLINLFDNSDLGQGIVSDGN